MASFFLSSSLAKSISHSKSSFKKLIQCPKFKAIKSKASFTHLSLLIHLSADMNKSYLTDSNFRNLKCVSNIFFSGKTSWYTNHNKAEIRLISGLWKVYFIWTVIFYFSSKLFGIFYRYKTLCCCIDNVKIFFRYLLPFV